MRKGAPVTIAVAAACLLLACAGEPLARACAWDRTALLHGEFWRLWTGHLVHWSASHAAVDAVALVAAGWLAEPEVGSRRFAAMLALGAPLLSGGLLLAPGLGDYRGASGMVLMVAGLAGAVAWRRHPGLRPALGAAALALMVKAWFDAHGHAATLAGLPAATVVAWQAHGMGAVLGWMAAVFSKLPTASTARSPAPAHSRTPGTGRGIPSG